MGKCVYNVLTKLNTDAFSLLFWPNLLNYYKAWGDKGRFCLEWKKSFVRFHKKKKVLPWFFEEYKKDEWFFWKVKHYKWEKTFVRIKPWFKEIKKDLAERFTRYYHFYLFKLPLSFLTLQKKFCSFFFILTKNKCSSPCPLKSSVSKQWLEHLLPLCSPPLLFPLKYYYLNLFRLQIK